MMHNLSRRTIRCPSAYFLLCNCLLQTWRSRSLQLERYHMAPWLGRIGTRSEENVRQRAPPLPADSWVRVKSTIVRAIAVKVAVDDSMLRKAVRTATILPLIEISASLATGVAET